MTRIALVEDNADNRLLVHAILEDLYEIDVTRLAPSARGSAGAAAFARAARHLAAGDGPDGGAEVSARKLATEHTRTGGHHAG